MLKKYFFYTIIYFIPVILIPKYRLYLQLLYDVCIKLRILSLIFIAHFKLFTFIMEFFIENFAASVGSDRYYYYIIIIIIIILSLSIARHCIAQKIYYVISATH